MKCFIGTPQMCCNFYTKGEECDRLRQQQANETRECLARDSLMSQQANKD